MHTGNQNEIPVARWHNASRRPSNVRIASPPPSFRGVPGSDGLRISFKETIFQRSENLYEVHLGKRRKIGGGNMVGQATHTRSRPPLPVLNAVPGNNDAVAAAASLNGDSSGGDTEFNSREDVETLLAERPTHKNRNDYKGRMKDMGGYIKKLQACINWYMELEKGYLGEQNKLRSLLESEEGRHSDIEVQMSCKIDELASSNEKHQKYRLMLEESLKKEEADKLVAIKSYEKEVEAKAALENLRFGLLEDQEKATKEMKCLNDQINMLQETNKRLQEYSTSLQHYNSNLQADASKSGDTILKLQKEKAVMTETLNGLRDQTSMLKNQLDTVRSSQQEAIKQREELNKEVGGLRSELQQVREDRDHHLENVQRINYELNKYKELTGKSLRDVNVALTKAAALEETCTSQQDQIRSLQYQLTSVNENLKMTDLVAIESVQENKAQKKLVVELQNHVADLEYQLVEAEKLRKKLHNTILELKGNIRVFCRVRPALQDIECRSADGPIVSYPTGVEYLGCGIDLMHNAQKYSFTFDKVFGHEASQEDVFVEISQLVQSALDGYKVCIFAYGQTGSGKTYTMMGKPQACDQKGLIPRSLEQIFEASQALKCQGWKYKMQASMLEIYNETIRDLLSPTRSSYIDSSTTNKQYTIKHDSNGNTHVSDLTVVDVCSINEVSFLLNQAAQSRSVGRTQMNEQSSRSHFVFTLRISGMNDATEQQVQGILNLIDLAGSERLAKSGSTGDRLRETQAINKSLSSLSDVIFAIARKEDHVPYRNSKLTYLLQPCLGGDSKTLMFVNISPEASSANESICSLRFAARVNSCEIGVPSRHTQMRSLDSRLSYG